MINLIIQEIPKIPEVQGSAGIYVWIISILVLVVIAIVTLYERKLNKVTDRLNIVIDENIERLERKNETEQSGLTRINDMLVQLKEIVVIASRRN